jgi:hypothetical protein
MNLYQYATTLLILTVTWTSCADPKKDLIDQHYDIYTSYLASTDYLLTPGVLAPSSHELLNAVQDLNLEQAVTLGEKHKLEYLLKAYYHAVQENGVAAVPLLDYVATMPKHPLSYQNTRIVIPDQTEVAPTPFVAVYYEGSGRKTLEWLKYDTSSDGYQLDLIFILRQLEKRLGKEVKDAKADYAALDVDSYLKNRFNRTTPDAIRQGINQLRPTRLSELGSKLSN